MNKFLFLGSAGYLAAVVALHSLLPSGVGLGEDARDAMESAGDRILEAATRFVATLSKEQEEKVLSELRDEGRYDWHFVPRSRKGLSLKELDERQRAALWALLDASLSEVGSKKARQVIQLEAVLGRLEGPDARFTRDPELYHVLLFSKPSADDSWGFRFEGHHLSLHFTLKGNEVLSATPSFFGANPALVRDGPDKGLRVLAGVEDVARKLVNSLDDNQRKRCTGDPDVPNEVPETGKPRYSGPFPAGVTLSDLTEEQRQTLHELVREYTQNLEPGLARCLEDAVKKEARENVHFAWRGGTEPFEPHSYLVHGKTFVINYSNVQNGGAHVHSVFRQLENDFGPDAGSKASPAGAKEN